MCSATVTKVDMADEAFRRWAKEFLSWNEKINLISRKDVDNLATRHWNHSISINRCLTFPAGAKVLDVGTGGGLPGIPLAMTNPQVQFTLLDSIGKKINAVQAMVDSLELRNVRAVKGRAEEQKGSYDFILGRAVTALPRFLSWVMPLLKKGSLGEVPRGVLYLKGTLYEEELRSVRITPWKVYSLDTLQADDYFAEKFLLHLRTEDILRGKFHDAH